MKRTLLLVVAASVLIVGLGPAEATARPASPEQLSQLATEMSTLRSLIATAKTTTSVKRSVRIAREMRSDCQFDWIDGIHWSPREEELTTDCVLRRWSVDGGEAKFDSVISCESGWSRFAYNAGGPYVGLGQHALSSWAGRVNAYRPMGWKLQPNWRNSRTQIVVTARMEAASGWGPWSCA